MNFNDAELAALASGVYRIGVFFRLETDPVVRLWLGFGNIEPGVNVKDTTGDIYKGFGELRNIPTFKQLLNGAAERVEFLLSGVSGEVLTIASGEDAEQVKGKPTDVGFALFGSDWAMLGAIHWTAHYIADFLAVEQARADIRGEIVRTVKLSVGSRFTGRRRAAFSYFSDVDQQARFPGDKFCQYAPIYARGFTKEFPVFA